MGKLFSKIICLFLIDGVAVINSCKKDEGGQGILSFYTGEFNSVNTTQKSALTWPYPNGVNEGYMYLKKIEISTTGKEWLTLLDDSVATPIKFKDQGELIKVTIKDKTVKVGEYHGLRISLEPKIRILDIGDMNPMDILFEKQPLAIYVSMGMSQLKSSIDTLEFTSANGFLIPFTVEENIETRIILHFIPQVQGNEVTHTITDWWTDVEARATRYLY